MTKKPVKKDTKFSKDNQPTTRGCGEVIAKSNKNRQTLSDEYRLALHREIADNEGKKTKAAAIIAKKIVDLAMDGDMQAAKELSDRTEGKAAQSVTVSGDENAPLAISITTNVDRKLDA